MNMEADLNALLATKCARTFPDVAPSGTAWPFVTWQGIGGAALGYLDNTEADKRSTLMQVSVYAASRAEALQLARQIETALRASAAFVAAPQGEAISTYEDDTKLRGCIQRFLITATR